MYCKKCGKELGANAKFCGGCGAVMDRPATNQGSTPGMNQTGGLVCKKCGFKSITISAVSEMPKRGCLSTLLIIILFFIPIIGWIALFMILRGRKSETVTYAVCQNCGAKYRV